MDVYANKFIKKYSIGVGDLAQVFKMLVLQARRPQFNLEYAC